MGFAKAVKTCLSKYGEFSGRASVAEYWWYVLFTVLVAILVTAMDTAIILQKGPHAPPPDAVMMVSTWVSLALILPSVAVTVRRLHDTDRSGWWYLIVFVPLIGALMLLVFSLLPGTPGRNRYGLPSGAAGAPSKHADAYATLLEPSGPRLSEEERQEELRALRMRRMTT